MNTSNPSDIISKLTEIDTFSILCSLLYELRPIPEYSLISELCYMINDQKSIEKVFSYMAGKTVVFPTKEEFSNRIKVLLLYQFAEVEKRPWKDALLLAGYKTSNGKKAHNDLDKLKQTLAKYNFGNRQY